MRALLLIAPYRIDAQYSSKKAIVKKLCEDSSLEFLTAEDIDTGNSLSAEETINFLKKCSFAIGDLSFERPSCYYEVGYLQSIDKKVYLLATSNTVIHQVLSKSSLKFYDNLEEYKALIAEIIKGEI